MRRHCRGDAPGCKEPRERLFQTRDVPVTSDNFRWKGPAGVLSRLGRLSDTEGAERSDVVVEDPHAIAFAQLGLDAQFARTRLMNGAPGHAEGRRRDAAAVVGVDPAQHESALDEAVAVAGTS